jgi:hypothetical protein
LSTSYSNSPCEPTDNNSLYPPSQYLHTAPHQNQSLRCRRRSVQRPQRPNRR